MSDTDTKIPLPDLENGGQIPALDDAGSLTPPDGEAIPQGRGRPGGGVRRAGADLGGARSRQDGGRRVAAAGPGAVLELDRKVGEAIDIYVNNRLVARGEVVLVEDKLGVTMTEIIKSEQLNGQIRTRTMRLLIVGTLKGQLTTATKIAMDKGACGHPRRQHRAGPCACCAPEKAPIS